MKEKNLNLCKAVKMYFYFLIVIQVLLSDCSTWMMHFKNICDTICHSSCLIIDFLKKEVTFKRIVHIMNRKEEMSRQFLIFQ